MIAQSKVILCCLILVGCQAALAQNSLTQANAVNVLIDVSGSMKQNDPENKRVSAVKLLLNLLPDDTQAGIWVFAENTKLLTKTSSVDRQWKKQALDAVRGIHSRGLYTHIEDAVQTVLKDGFEGGGGKNLILLTDGMVDTSKDIMQSAESRERIISDLIPRLQERRIKVQAIALSDNADKELLEKLSFDTGGWYESADSADQLQKTFLKMFNKVLPRDSVPLYNNQFAIDNSVKEFSVLIFRKAGAKPTVLVEPDGNKLNAQSRFPNLSWVQDSGYDLISVQQPASGQWTIDAAKDPDNQVMVLTDLKLHCNELPSHIAQGEPLELALHLTEQGKTIVQDDFLRLVDMTLQQTDALNRKSTWSMSPQYGNGLYKQRLGETLDKGRHTLKIIADGKTFQREVVRIVEVVDSVVKVKKTIDTEKRSIKLELQPDAEMIDPTKISGQAIIHYADKPDETRDFQIEDGNLQLTVDLPAKGEKAIVNFSVMAKTLQGTPISPSIKPVIIDEHLLRELTEKQEYDTLDDNGESENSSQVSLPPKERAGEEIEEQSESQETEEEVEDEDTVSAESGSWGLVIATVAGANLLLIGSCFFGYRWTRKRTAEKQQQLLDRLT